MTTALIIVDVQFDFIDGSLAVPDAHDVLEPIAQAGDLADFAVFTRDFHPPNHCSFSDDPQFVDKSWPKHCVQNTAGVLIHPYLERKYPDMPVFSKGVNPEVEEYSGFSGGYKDTTLDYFLNHPADYLPVDVAPVERLLVCGLATDYCVKSTVIDGLNLGYEVIVLADAVRGVNPVTTAVAVADMVDSGAAVTTSELYRQIGA